MGKNPFKSTRSGTDVSQQPHRHEIAARTVGSMGEGRSRVNEGVTSSNPRQYTTGRLEGSMGKGPERANVNHFGKGANRPEPQSPKPHAHTGKGHMVGGKHIRGYVK